MGGRGVGEWGREQTETRRPGNPDLAMPKQVKPETKAPVCDIRRPAGFFPLHPPPSPSFFRLSFSFFLFPFSGFRLPSSVFLFPLFCSPRTTPGRKSSVRDEAASRLDPNTIPQEASERGWVTDPSVWTTAGPAARWRAKSDERARHLPLFHRPQSAEGGGRICG